MIIPSIDLMQGNAVQLIGGEKKAIDAGDPKPIADEFGLVGEIAVIDLDAALGSGENSAVIKDLLTRARCRVGGGIRDVETAIKWLDAGASKVILGTAATPEVLSQLPKDRVIAALDARDDEVVVKGWTAKTGRTIESRMDELKQYVGGFLVTFVEREGRMGGLPVERARALKERAGDATLTVAGGVREPADIAAMDAMGIETQVGMALYSGKFDLAQGYCSSLKTDRPDGLWPTVVTDVDGTALGLTYSSLKSVREAINTRSGVYFSRSRNELWKKGASSGSTQELLSIDVDCDRDALKFTVRQNGTGFCHTGSSTCFGQKSGVNALQETLLKRIADAPEGSYTKRLLGNPSLLESKLLEEATELVEATTPSDAAAEAADLLYFGLVTALSKGARLEDIEQILDQRALKVTRRPGDAKPGINSNGTSKMIGAK